MKPIEIHSISELVEKSRDHYATVGGGPDYHSSILYRGQSDAEWHLKTTLERFSTCSLNLSEYTEYARLIGDRFPELCAASPHARLSPVNSWAELTENSDNRQIRDAMVSLRHLGFPSPLLDWTRSPYIAAYFAFRGAESTGQVSVFALKEYAGCGKMTEACKPRICSLGPNLRTHRRHHIQQAEYTACLVKCGSDTIFQNHQSVFLQGDLHQDLLVQYVLPCRIRDDALNELHLMNINEHSLFGTEEGLCRALAQELIPRWASEQNRT